MSILMESANLWGNMYRRRYYLNGRRITETHANYILKHHAQERLGTENHATGWKTRWNIGPRFDAPSMTDHPDCT